MTRIGILGGSFNPIHKGHIRLAEGAMSAFSLDKIIFVPTGNHAFKSDRDIPEARVRYCMTLAAVEQNSNYEVSTIEVNRRGISYMIDTLRELKSIYCNKGDDVILCLITGADIIFEIDRWRSFEKFGNFCTLCVALRPGYASDKVENRIEFLSKKYHIEIQLAEINALDISSTEIRAIASRGGDISEMVPEGTANYIRVNKIYEK